jgi:hypothetical protein
MILRYTVEKEGTPTFTASKKVSSALDAMCFAVNLTKSDGGKYSNFRLYTNENIFVQDVTPPAQRAGDNQEKRRQ